MTNALQGIVLNRLKGQWEYWQASGEQEKEDIKSFGMHHDIAQIDWQDEFFMTHAEEGAFRSWLISEGLSEKPQSDEVRNLGKNEFEIERAGNLQIHTTHTTENGAKSVEVDHRANPNPDFVQYNVEIEGSAFRLLQEKYREQGWFDEKSRDRGAAEGRSL